MWLFLSSAYLSIVQDKSNPKHLLVRARRRGDIERVFNTKRVRETPEGDYRFRASIPRAIVADTIRAAVAGVAYDNFKSSVEDLDRHEAYLDVWAHMLDWQEAHTPRPRPPAPAPAKQLVRLTTKPRRRSMRRGA
jgi:hypothetical protein